MIEEDGSDGASDIARDSHRKYFSFRRDINSMFLKWGDENGNKRYRNLAMHKAIVTGRFCGRPAFSRYLRGEVS